MTSKKTDGLKTAIVAGALIALGASANAQSLQTYFDFSTYGTVAASSTIVDQTGNTHATLNNDSITTLTSSGLTSAGGGNSGNNGLTFASGSLSGFTGSFTIQDWVTRNSTTGVTLFGGNGWNQGANTGLPGPQNTYIGDGYTGISALLGFTWGSLVGGGGTGNPLGQTYNRYGNTVSGYSMNVGQLYDLVLTYDASTYTFNQYINGALVGSLQEAFSSTSLAGVEVFGIGGAPGQPWSDPSAAATTSDFLLYNGELTASQVAALDSAGAGASIGTINGIVAPVPEPTSMALMVLSGGFGLLLWRRRPAK
jgi:hypothetical protein